MSAYATLPDYADLEYVDGKLVVASGIARRTKNPARRRRWLTICDELLDARIAMVGGRP